jgi:hypothetical protein
MNNALDWFCILVVIRLGVVEWPAAIRENKTLKIRMLFIPALMAAFFINFQKIDNILQLTFLCIGLPVFSYYSAKIIALGFCHSVLSERRAFGIGSIVYTRLFGKH